ncbi:LysR family transcriptional regulator [Anaerosacchariphilus polymeriproducens]|uniref:LysR family transcriptional regulator n=1 Tax=Anaerosacchariphilus polymeriproducens TaxID=1812858 RepID=A0A371AUL6_9FIRM|nr:LysR family transcriptional regulator [Anaerosacchariphilus polymeriproducens]RDU23265.1 LysR family transcriptional regulator [Anaerosacchariphilus polymeriproducens]
MNQQLSSYKVFYTVANTGNISHAAKQLYISQPAISRTIQRLEQSLGVILFSRNSRGVQLTSEGLLLYNHVKSAFDTLELGEKQLQRVSDLGIGQIHIGVSTTLCKYVLLPYLKKFIEKFPHVNITIECQSTNQTLELIEQQKIDVALIGKPSSLKGLDFIPIGEIEDIFVATKNYLHFLNERETINQSTKKQKNFFETATLMLLDKNNMTRQYIDDYFIKNQIKTNNILEVTSMDLLIEFANIGLGIACVIKEFVKKDLQSGHLIEIPLNIPIHKREIGFAYLNQNKLTHSLEQFISSLTKI